MGVDVRLHPLMLLFLLFCMVFGSLTNATAGRGLVLWFLVLFSIAVRETGRALAAAWTGMQLQSLTIFPIGAVPVYGLRADRRRKHELLLALSGPIANFIVGITLLMLLMGATPTLALFDRPYVHPAHLVRAFIWCQILLGALHMLPAYPLDAGTVLRHTFMRARGAVSGARAAAGLTQVVGFSLLLAGIAFQNVWTIAMGASVLAGIQIETGESAPADPNSPVENVRMRDVMLHEFTTLGASDTLEEALERSAHSLQDIFPVTRGPLLVGSISRQTIADALEAQGNGYIQGLMTRSLSIASPDDAVVSTLRKLAGAGGTQLLPVVQEDGRLLGIVTPQNLSQSMSLLGRSQRIRQMSREDSE